MPDLDTLIQLQAIDLDLDGKRTRLDEIKASLGVSAELRAARAALEAARKKLHEDEARQRQLEWEAEDRGGKVKELDGRLYSGKIGNPKELAGLQTEIQHMRADLSTLEERTLDAISATDDQRAETKRREAALAEIETRWRDDQVHLKAEQAELTGAVEALAARRQSMSADVAAPAMTKYEELRRTRRGLAVARVERNMCLGCRTTLATSEVQAARQGRVAHCGACGRFLNPGR